MDPSEYLRANNVGKTNATSESGVIKFIVKQKNEEGSSLGRSALDVAVYDIEVNKITPDLLCSA